METSDIFVTEIETKTKIMNFRFTEIETKIILKTKTKYK